MDLENTGLADREETEKLVEDYLMQIGEVLNDEDWWKAVNPDADTFVLNMDISRNMSRSFNSGRAYSLGGSQIGGGVTLSMSFHDDGALVHELTHIVGVGNTGEFSIGLCEGLCEYTQIEIGDVFYNEEWEFQDSLSVLMKTEITYSEEGREMIYEILGYVGRADMGCPYGQGYQMMMWYNMNHSFVRYLIDVYGMNWVRDFIRYGENEDSYEEYFDKSYEELKDEWFSYMLSYDNSITIEDVVDYAQQSYGK